MSCFTAILKTQLIGIRIHLSDGRSHPFVGFLLVLAGLFDLLRPEDAWYLSLGWKFKDAEPSEDAILWCRVSGVIAIVIGILLFF